MVIDSNWVFIVCIVDDGSPPRPPLFGVRSVLALEDLNRPPILPSLPGLARDSEKKKALEKMVQEAGEGVPFEHRGGSR